MRKEKTKNENLSRKVEVDVSGLLADTKDTVFAFANGDDFAILIPAKTKRLALKYFRLQYGVSKPFYIRFYIAGLVVLLRPFLSKFDLLVLDTEFYGLDTRVRDYLGNRFGKLFPREKIIFKQIGKKSPAHFRAKGVFVKMAKPDKIIEFQELKKLL